ncbi:protein of unknown function [Candidatus Nitrospira inopinata]|uniref:Uncharacterized protein n=1 Tax=Candidatus Nitrospira inopinata TaxID=1715989 RepID=A0A0S4KSW1_9BACT|nr:protein of unknown function [Candidatus Nitrospira inopinata]
MAKISCLVCWLANGMVLTPSGGMPFGVWVKFTFTVKTPAGETACCELITTKQLADPQDASAACSERLAPCANSSNRQTRRRTFTNLRLP